MLRKGKREAARRRKRARSRIRPAFSCEYTKTNECRAVVLLLRRQLCIREVLDSGAFPPGCNSIQLKQGCVEREPPRPAVDSQVAVRVG